MVAWQKLKQEYEPVAEATQLGDVIVYLEKLTGEMRHACVHVAGGVVFTKNGFGSFRPWCLMHRDDMEALYVQEGLIERRVFRPRPTQNLP